MEHEHTSPTADGWTELEALLRWITVLFGEALAARAALTRKVATDAARWLHAAEALTRCLVLAMAQAMTLAAVTPRAKALRAKAKTKSRGRGLFCFPQARSRSTTRSVRRAMTFEEEQDWMLFGGRERARAEREARLAAGWRPTRRAPVPARAARIGEDVAMRPLRGFCPPTTENLVHRFNALVAVLDAPDGAARRLARRLAVAPQIAVRIRSRAQSRKGWGTGYEGDVARAADRCEPPPCDSS